MRVAFDITIYDGWQGGLNYIRNLISALDSHKDPSIECIFFCGHNSSEKLIEQFRPFGPVIKSDYFDGRTIASLLWRRSRRYFQTDIALLPLLKKHKIQLISHSGVIRIPGIKCINWIPDFQHLHLPEFFSNEEIKKRNKHFRLIIEESDTLILSSMDAKNDLLTYFNKSHAYVLPFPVAVENTSPESYPELISKYKIPEKYFFLPNQLWKHKNHKIVFDALLLLKKEGLEISVVCSGREEDHRGNEHIIELKDFIHRNNLSVNFLGVIPHSDVLNLMKASVAVINPSLFEGWSTTVEEAKSLQKHIILSTLNVHLEQAPKRCDFFTPTSPDQLSAILLKLWLNPPVNEGIDTEITNRIHIFAERFKEILKTTAAD